MGRGLFLGDIDPRPYLRRLLPFGAHGVEAAYVDNGAAVGLQLADAEAFVACRPGLLSLVQQALRVLLGDLHDAPVDPQLPRLRAELVPQAQGHLAHQCQFCI